MGKQQNQNSKKNYRIFPFQQGVRTLRSLIFAFERQVFVKQKAESTAGKKKIRTQGNAAASTTSPLLAVPHHSKQALEQHAWQPCNSIEHHG